MDRPPYSPDIPLRFLALSKTKKCPEGTKIYPPFWHPTGHENVTARYFGKRFSRLHGYTVHQQYWNLFYYQL